MTDETEIWVTPSDFTDVKVGDTVVRMLAGIIRMEQHVVKVDDLFIYTAHPDHGWRFERTTGLEYDPELNGLVSFLVREDEG